MPRGNPPRPQRAGLSPAWLCALCGQQARTASVELSKAPDVCAQDIADHTLALLRAATRQIVQAHESVRQGRAPKGDVPYRWRDGVLERAAEVDFLVVCASGGPGIIVNQGHLRGAKASSLGDSNDPGMGSYNPVFHGPPLNVFAQLR